MSGTYPLCGPYDQCDKSAYLNYRNAEKTCAERFLPRFMAQMLLRENRCWRATNES